MNIMKNFIAIAVVSLIFAVSQSFSQCPPGYTPMGQISIIYDEDAYCYLIADWCVKDNGPNQKDIYIGPFRVAGEACSQSILDDVRQNLEY
jgi:hypothetical protein